MIIRRTVKFQRKKIGPDRLDESRLQIIVTWWFLFIPVVVIKRAV